MKFLVDSLPYYGDTCPFEYICNAEEKDCPRHWGKYKVTDENRNPHECENRNPHECEYLKELQT